MPTVQLVDEQAIIAKIVNGLRGYYELSKQNCQVIYIKSNSSRRKSHQDLEIFSYNTVFNSAFCTGNGK